VPSFKSMVAMLALVQTAECTEVPALERRIQGLKPVRSRACKLSVTGTLNLRRKPLAGRAAAVPQAL
jgi:hypothetical protein